MSSTCISSATLTRTDTTTSQSLSTTVSNAVTTLPGSVSTSIFSTCTVPTGVTTTCIPTVTSSLITLPGETTTIEVPVTVTLDIPITATITLWGTSCTTAPTSLPPVVTTPPPTVITSQSPTVTDGSTIFVTYTLTSNLPPTTLTTQPPPTNLSDNKEPGKPSNVGPIVGGVIGGIAALIILGLLTFKFIKNQSRFDDFFNRDDDRNTNNTAHFKNDSIVPLTPKPYDYGIVGHQDTNPTGLSPPNSPPPTNATFGNDIGAYNQPSASPPQHIRNPSQTPLLAGLTAAAATSGAASGAAHGLGGGSRPSTSRPSTSGSIQPIGPLVSHASQNNMGYPPHQNYVPTSYPPALQNWSQQQAHGPGQQGQAVGAGQVQGQGPLSHNASVTSTATTPSMYSTNTWGGAPSSAGTSAGTGVASSSLSPNLPGIIPIVAATTHRPQQPQHQRQPSYQHPQPQRFSQHLPQQQGYAQYEDPFARNGSPVSIQEQRILQVTNNTEPAGYRQSIDTSSSYAEGSSSVFTTAGAVGGASGSGSGSGAASGSGPTRTTSPGRTAVDGKGRPLHTLGEKAPLVHLDGGLYQEPLTGSGPGQAGTPAPPAYIE